MSKQNKNEQFIDGAMLSRMVRGGAAELRSNAEEVNQLNVFPVPDGDTGDNMRMTLESGLNALEKTKSKDLAEVMRALSHGMLLGARGNSGVILSQFFAGIAAGLDTYSRADAAVLGHALTEGVRRAYASVVTPKEGTILTVAREAVDYAVGRITPKSTIRSLFSDLIKEMSRSLIRTPELLPILKEAGVIDSGGAGLFHIMNGFHRALSGKDLELLPTAEPPRTASDAVDLDAFGPDSVLTFGYCTEFLLRLQTAKVDPNTFDVAPITRFLESVGDSIVIFRTDSIVKVHVHTKTPEKVLAYCHQYGEFLTLKIENMSLAHTSQSRADAPAEQTAAKKRYGAVAVASGEGMCDTFTQLGADVVINGGQTQNPSTQDFLEAFEKVNAEHIFVFPNNANILMAATQAGSLYEKAAIHVIKTVNIAGGYAALPLIAEQDEPDAVLQALTEAAERVAEGTVTTSVRDTELSGIRIRQGDFIGICGKQIIASAASATEVACDTLHHLITSEERAVLTVFYGKDAEEDTKAAIRTYLAENAGDVELYEIDGGQPVYPYIMIAE